MLFSNKQIDRLNRGCPMLAGVRVGDKFEKLEKGDLSEAGISDVGINFPVFITYEIAADASSGLKIFDADAPFAFEILDVIVEARATVGGGTAKLTDVAPADITDAIICAADKDIERAGTIDASKSTVAKNGTLIVITTNAGDRGLVTIVARKT